MEYEIGDDPQGLSEEHEGDRDGGLKESLFFRQGRKLENRVSPRDMAVEQMGEPV